MRVRVCVRVHTRQQGGPASGDPAGEAQGTSVPFIHLTNVYKARTVGRERCGHGRPSEHITELTFRGLLTWGRGEPSKARWSTGNRRAFALPSAGVGRS